MTWIFTFQWLALRLLQTRQCTAIDWLNDRQVLIQFSQTFPCDTYRPTVSQRVFRRLSPWRTVSRRCSRRLREDMAWEVRDGRIWSVVAGTYGGRSRPECTAPGPATSPPDAHRIILWFLFGTVRSGWLNGGIPGLKRTMALRQLHSVPSGDNWRKRRIISWMYWMSAEMLGQSLALKLVMARLR